jgi:hypothetical protein
MSLSSYPWRVPAASIIPDTITGTDGTVVTVVEHMAGTAGGCSGDHATAGAVAGDRR